MTAIQDRYLPGDAPRSRQKVAKALAIAMQTVLGAIRANSRPAKRHLRDHAYTWVGFGLISLASFTHSMFTGFLVTGILALVFEWKAGDDE